MIPQILYDNRNIEIYPKLIDELERQNIIEFDIWTPIYCSRSAVESINLSQKKIVQWAKDSGEKEVCILEHDVWFPNENGWQYFLSNKPVDYDIYIGGSYFIDNRIEYKAPLVKVKEHVGNHCIIIHERYYDKFLNVPVNEHIDAAQSGLGDFYVCFPFAALQRPSKSANNNFEIVNYNTNIPKEYIYQ